MKNKKSFCLYESLKVIFFLSVIFLLLVDLLPFLMNVWALKFPHMACKNLFILWAEWKIYCGEKNLDERIECDFWRNIFSQFYFKKKLFPDFQKNNLFQKIKSNSFLLFKFEEMFLISQTQKKMLGLSCQKE